MITRTLLLCVGVAAAALGCVFEVGAFASAQASAPPLIVVATIPPQPTPLPPLIVPREEFAEFQTVAGDAAGAQAPEVGSEQALQIALASYGVVTVSIDQHNAANSAALISTPHGVLMRRAGEAVDGYRIAAITASGVTFVGGAMIPVGYSQQGSNPSVPPIGGSLPVQRVPVNVTLPSPEPSPPGPAVVTPGPVQSAKGGIRQISPFQTPSTPAVLNGQRPLNPPTFVTPNDPTPGGSPQP